MFLRICSVSCMAISLSYFYVFVSFIAIDLSFDCICLGAAFRTGLSLRNKLYICGRCSAKAGRPLVVILFVGVSVSSL